MQPFWYNLGINWPLWKKKYIYIYILLLYILCLSMYHVFVYVCVSRFTVFSWRFVCDILKSKSQQKCVDNKSVGQSLIFWSNPRTKILKIHIIFFLIYKYGGNLRIWRQIWHMKSKSEIWNRNQKYEIWNLKSKYCLHN